MFLLVALVAKWEKTLPFPIHGDISTTGFDLIHTYVCCIAPIVSCSHYKYFITFINNYRQYISIYFLHLYKILSLPWRSIFQMHISHINFKSFSKIKASYLKRTPIPPQQNGGAEARKEKLPPSRCDHKTQNLNA